MTDGPVYRAEVWTKPFMDFVRSVGVLSDETVFDLGTRGLYARQIDPAAVAIVEATLEPNAFPALPLVGDPSPDDAHKHTFGIDLEALREALSYATRRKAPSVALELRRLGREGEASLGLTIAYASLRRAVAGPSDGEPYRSKWPKVHWDPVATLKADARSLRLAVCEVEGIADAVCLRATRGERADRVVLTAPYGSDVSGDSLVDTVEVEGQHFIEGKDGEVHAHYPTEYLVGILKVCQAPTLTLTFGTDYPMMIESAFERRVESGLMETVGRMRYMVAPRVDHDEEAGRA